ncbi:MAG: dihydropteroate synthase [Bacteroidia bacterium]|nr:dihydropteroate synthase [Bacteroidia bacterium]
MNTGHYTINIKGTLLDLSTPKIMGILNVTSDSFFDGGNYVDINTASRHVASMVRDGVDIIDVGGASSRPGADEVSLQQELDRVLPIIEWLGQNVPDVPVSIDTNKAEVAKQAVQAGAAIVNDISAGDDDMYMVDTVASLKVPYIAMHKKGTPKTMQVNPTYTDVVEDVATYFIDKLDRYKCAGITDVIFDPGFGFGKTVNHNYSLLRNLNVFDTLLKRPILVGVSRKSMINKVLGVSPDEALNGTTVLNTLAVQNGAHILRVHDVKEAKQIVQLMNAYSGNGDS